LAINPNAYCRSPASDNPTRQVDGAFSTAFLFLGATALIAFVLLLFAMPETGGAPVLASADDTMSKKAATPAAG